MEKHHFFRDRHVEELLVFHPHADLHAMPLVVECALILQDKVRFDFPSFSSLLST